MNARGCISLLYLAVGSCVPLALARALAYLYLANWTRHSSAKRLMACPHTDSEKLRHQQQTKQRLDDGLTGTTNIHHTPRPPATSRRARLIPDPTTGDGPMLSSHPSPSQAKSSRLPRLYARSEAASRRRQIRQKATCNMQEVHP
eukprot:scaffold6917_cov143-Isochrysis_galbana.AAC.2